MLKGNYEDLPNMIFFPEHCDTVANWIPFFTNPEYKILDHRNVWVVYPRNFGNSDRYDSYDMGEIADDVARFMYEHRISTATLAGHGFGGKVALATACYHHDRVTGVFGIDTSPMDHRYFVAFKEFKHYIERLRELDIKSASLKDIESYLKS